MGVPDAAVTVAVNVTGVPKVEGFGAAVSCVVVTAGPNVTVTTVPVLALAAKVAFPP